MLINPEITASGVEPRPQFNDGYCSVGAGSTQEFNNDATERNDPPKCVCICLICYVKFNPEPCPQLSTSTPVPVCGNDFGKQPATPLLPPISNAITKVNSTSKELFDIFCRYMNLPSSSVDFETSGHTSELTDSSSMNSPFCNSCASSLQDLLDYHEHIQELVKLTKQITAKLTMKIVESCGRNMKMKEGHKNTIPHSSVRIDEEQSANVDINDDMNDKRRKNCRTDQSELIDTLYENYIADGNNSLSELLKNFQEMNATDKVGLETEKHVYVGREQTLWGKMDALRQFIYDRYDVKVHVSRLHNETQPDVFDSNSDGSGNLYVNNDSDEHIIEYASDLSDLNISIPIVEFSEYGPNSASNSPSMPWSPSLSQATFPNDDEDEEFQVDSNSHDLNPTDLMEFSSNSRSSRMSATRMTRVNRGNVTVKLEPPPPLTSDEDEDEDYYENNGEKSCKKKMSSHAQRCSSRSCEEVSPGEFLYAGKVRFLQMQDGYRCGTCFVKKTTKLEIMGHCYSSHCRNKKRCEKKNNRLVEISTNMFLYGNKYFVKKVKNNFKCCLCGKCLGRKYKLLQHIRVTHIRGEAATSETKNLKAKLESKNSNKLAKTKTEVEIKSGAQFDVETEVKTVQNNCAEASRLEVPTFSKIRAKSKIDTVAVVDEVKVEMMGVKYDNKSISNSLDSTNPILPQNPSFNISELIHIPIPLPESRSRACDEEKLDSDSDTEMNPGGKRYVEIGPNKFLYAKEYIFEKVGQEYKCHTCGFQHERLGKMCIHMRSSHIKARKTTRVNNKWVEVSPDKYVYAYKYTVERIEGRYKCCTCEYTTKGKYKMFEHLRTKHLNPVEGFMCDNCGKQFNRRENLRQHNKFVCIKAFNSGDGMDELHICPMCGKSFKNEYYLKTHERYHGGEDKKNFQCEYCGQKFWGSSKLKDHMAQKHTGEKLFQCQFCDTRFTTYNNMHYHRIRTHGRVGELLGSSSTTQTK